MEIQNTAAKSCENLAATAVEYAASLGKVLDYTPASVSVLDEILQIYHEDIHHSEPTEDQVYSVALIFGAYLGECIRPECPAGQRLSVGDRRGRTGAGSDGRPVRSGEQGLPPPDQL